MLERACWCSGKCPRICVNGTTQAPTSVSLPALVPADGLQLLRERGSSPPRSRWHCWVREGGGLDPCRGLLPCPYHPGEGSVDTGSTTTLLRPDVVPAETLLELTMVKLHTVTGKLSLMLGRGLVTIQGTVCGLYGVGCSSAGPSYTGFGLPACCTVCARPGEEHTGLSRGASWDGAPHTGLCHHICHPWELQRNIMRYIPTPSSSPCTVLQPPPIPQLLAIPLPRTRNRQREGMGRLAVVREVWKAAATTCPSDSPGSWWSCC